MIDFVWPYYSAESKGVELDLSILSVSKYFQRSRSVVVSEVPITTGSRNIVAKRVNHSKYQSFRDTLNRLKITIDTDWISEDFVWMMDDIYFVNPTNLLDLRTPRYNIGYSKNTIDRFLPSNKWRTLCRNSFDALLDSGEPVVYNYACHLPLLLNKSKVSEILDKYDHNKRMYSWDILYFNEQENKGILNKGFQTRFTSDPTIRRLENFCKDVNVMNHTNTAWGPNIESFLRERLK